uniref:Uncharacterized protein n=1 Tax=Mus spicilegus TaxID=10103 RepID=A0A8C6MNB7_MUSSI
ISASDTPKSRLDTSSFPPVSTPAPPPKPLSKRSCCHLSGSCFGWRETVPALTLLYGAGRFLPPPAAPRPALPRPRPPLRPPRWLRFSLMMSSKDMSILSAMAGADSGLGSSPRVSTRGRGLRAPPWEAGRSSGVAWVQRSVRVPRLSSPCDRGGPGRSVGPTWLFLLEGSVS